MPDVRARFAVHPSMRNFVPMLLLTLVCIGVAYRSKHERPIVFWLMWSGIIQILMESSFAIFHHVVTHRATTSFADFMLSPSPSIASWFDPRWWASIYGQYSRYDARYAISDPFPIALGYVEIVQGAACFWLGWAIQTGHRFRHPVQLILTSTQLYGTIYYFALPIAAGKWSEWMTHDPFELWVYVILLNGLWVVVPLLLMIQSTRQWATLIPSTKRDLA
jgi:cholestenol delta-isomerase